MRCNYHCQCICFPWMDRWHCRLFIIFEMCLSIVPSKCKIYLNAPIKEPVMQFLLKKREGISSENKHVCQTLFPFLFSWCWLVGSEFELMPSSKNPLLRAIDNILCVDKIVSIGINVERKMRAIFRHHGSICKCDPFFSV